MDHATISEILDLSDEQGVLSFYTGHVPSQAADPQPTAPIELRNQLKQLRRRIQDGDRELAQAIERRLDRMDGELEGLLDPKAPGRGRALFVGVSSGEQRLVQLHLPFRERVVHDATAFVRPLVAAVDEGRPAVIAVVSRGGVRVLDWSAGQAVERINEAFEPDEDLFRDDASGPSSSNPQRAMFARSDREGYEERLDEHRHRFLKQILDDVVQRARSEGIDRMVLSGPPKLRDEARGLIGDNSGLRVLVADQAWESDAPHEIAANAWTLLRSVHEERERDFVSTAVERALGGGAATLGLRHVCEALNQGRVERLLYDDRLVLEGFVSSERTLHPRIEGPGADSDLTFERERLFVERMVEAALATSASVTPLGEAAAAGLEEHEGVGALLRW